MRTFDEGRRFCTSLQLSTPSPPFPEPQTCPPENAPSSLQEVPCLGPNQPAPSGGDPEGSRLPAGFTAPSGAPFKRPQWVDGVKACEGVWLCTWPRCLVGIQGGVVLKARQGSLGCPPFGDEPACTWIFARKEGMAACIECRWASSCHW